jgi:hypothetical protein
MGSQIVWVAVGSELVRAQGVDRDQQQEPIRIAASDENKHPNARKRARHGENLLAS